VLQIEGEQRTLRSEAFVAECEQGRLFQYTFYFFAKPKEAWEIFRVILNKIIEYIGLRCLLDNENFTLLATCMRFWIRLWWVC
jgi:hypothetical protein